MLQSFLLIMDETNSLIEQRKAKLAALRAKGIDPFQNKFTPDRQCDEARSKFDAGELAEGARVAVAGRITAHRDMGKSIFIDVRDQSGRVQVYAQKQALGDEQFDIFKHLDLADFVGVTGTMFRTKPTSRASSLNRSPSSPRRCVRRPRSGTGWRTLRFATASATST